MTEPLITLQWRLSTNNKSNSGVYQKRRPVKNQVSGFVQMITWKGYSKQAQDITEV